MLDWIEGIAQSVSDSITGYVGPVADFLADYVWGWPEKTPLLAVVLLLTGLFVTLRMVFIQVRGFKHAWDITLGRYDNPDDEGDLKHFQALTTALSATVGIGNIAGVAIGIRLGGPGALFWMWLTAFLGMALKYTECTLAHHFRTVHPDGSVSGGPMYYIERGLGRGWKPMAVFFATMCMICSFGTGNMNQSNTMADQMHSQFGIDPFWTGLVAAILVGTVIIGGVRRIGRVTSILAPGMAALYVSGALVILVLNWREVPGGIGLIVTQAFSPEPLVGGAAGSFIMTLMWGIRRGLFSNEAGQGSAPIAHATAKTQEPVREGLVASLEPFIDTLVICTMTGLVIVTSGAFKDRVEQHLDLGDDLEIVLAAGGSDTDLLDLRQSREGGAPATVTVLDGRPVDFTLFRFDATVDDPRFETSDGEPWSGRLTVDPEEGKPEAEGEGPAPEVVGRALLTGAPMTAHAFKKELPGDWGNIIVTLAVLLFAVSTGISWSYYGDRATEYLFGAGAIPVYRWIFVFFFFLGAILPLKAVWTFGDVALGLMSFPNLIALIALSGLVARMTVAYFSKEQKRYW